MPGSRTCSGLAQTWFGFSNENPECKETPHPWENWEVSDPVELPDHNLSSKDLMGYVNLPINYIIEYSYLSLHLNNLFC